MNRLILALAAFAAAAVPAFADPIELKFASPAPAPLPAHKAVMQVWIDKVMADSEGTLSIELVPGAVLGAHGQMLDRVKSGVVAIAWDIQGYYPGKFPKSDIVALPFNFNTSTEGTLAFNRILADGTIADEYSDVKVLTLFTFPNGGPLSAKPINSVDDFAGQKFTAINPARQAMIAALGGVPVSLGIADWYQGLSRGVIDGAIESMSAVPPFRLNEVAHAYLNVPMGGNPAFVFMSKEIYDGLPEAAKKAIDRNSGEELARMMGGFWDGFNGVGQKMLESAGATFTTLDPAEETRWKAKIEPVVTKWMTDTPDGAPVLDKFRAAVASVREQK